MLKDVPALQSDKARQILGLILHAAHTGRHPPSQRELADAIGVWQQGVVHHLWRLRRAGLITWDYHRVRTLRPTCRFITVDQLFPQPKGASNGHEDEEAQTRATEDA